MLGKLALAWKLGDIIAIFNIIKRVVRHGKPANSLLLYYVSATYQRDLSTFFTRGARYSARYGPAYSLSKR